MATTALGPTFAGGMQPIVENGYELLYYPDVNNNALQAEGKSPVFYWLPNYVHIARKNGNPEGDALFSCIRFAGREGEDGTGDSGEGATSSVAGGVLGFSVTCAPPDHVLKSSQDQIKAMFAGKDDFFWGIRTNREPVFRPVPIVSNQTTVSNLSPLASGSGPAPVADLGGGDAPAPSDGTPPNRSIAPRVRSLFVQKDSDTVSEEVRSRTPVALRGYASVRSIVNNDSFIEKNSLRTIPFKELSRYNNDRGKIDPWFWNMQGQGKGGIDPMGVDAYTALLGAYPTALVWQAFHGSYTPIFVDYLLKVKFWTPLIEVHIHGEWEKIFSHFSAHANGRYAWFSADIKTELNNMRTNGTITVDIKVDATIPNGEKVVEQIEKRSDLVFEKFMEQAKTMIFDPPQPNVEAAQSKGSPLSIFSLFGGGLALKYRRDSTKLNLSYHEKRQLAYLQEVPISGSLEGMYDEIRRNPEAEKKYFQTVYLNDWPQKLARVTKPVVDFTRQPVDFMDVQVGYPNTRGELVWVGRTFMKSNPPDTTGIFEMVQKNAADVANAPGGWTPDTTFIKRTVHMKEAVAVNTPYDKSQILDEQVRIDPGPNGTLTNDINIEVRADDAARIRLGPVGLGVELENAKQIVEVTFQVTDEHYKPLPQFASEKFTWKFDDQETPRFWTVYTSDAAIRPYYQYQVKVIVKGSLFTKGMEWAGPWVRSLGNGPLMITVPTPEDRDTRILRSFRWEEVEKPAAALTEPAPPAGDGTPPSGDRELPPTEVPAEEEASIEVRSFAGTYSE